jgi:hypothetical protein
MKKEMKIEDVEKIMEDSREAMEYRDVRLNSNLNRKRKFQECCHKV